MATYAIGDVQGCFDELQPATRCSSVSTEAGPAVVRRRPGQPRPEVAGGAALRARARRSRRHRARQPRPAPRDAVRGLRAAAQGRYVRRRARGARRRRARRLAAAAADDARRRATARWCTRGFCRNGRSTKPWRWRDEVEQALRGPDYRDFLANMYGSKPDEWSESPGRLGSPARHRQRNDALTLLHAAGAHGVPRQGRSAARGIRSVVRFAARTRDTLVCGHWSALGLKLTDKLAALDSGCVWGGHLSALRLEDRALFQVPCAGYQAAGGEA